jgi:hypothetical protein
MPARSVLHVHSVLLQMIRQDFTIPTGAKGPGKEKSHIWEVRHAGLLGIKYEVAVRSDVVEAAASSEVKSEDAVNGDVKRWPAMTTKSASPGVGHDVGLDVKMELIQEEDDIKTETTLPEPGPQHILQDVVDAAVLG